MAKVSVSKAARQDLVAIKQYISEELCNPIAATRIIGKLKKEITSLDRFAERGKALDTLISIHTEYRYLVCENYCIFYLTGKDEVVVIRILHQRQDYLRALFM